MKKGRIPSRLFTILVFLFLYAPIFVLIIFSFNSTKSRTVWSGFSLNWYFELFKDSIIIDSFYTTISVAVMSSLIATVFGTAAAIGFNALSKRTRGAAMLVNSIPLINPDIITGVSLMLLFVFAASFTHLETGFVTLLLAHITFNIPYVILSVMPKLRQLNKNLFEAAVDLGATPLLAFRKVIFPELRPGIVNGLIIAFTMSIDDFVISYFTSGSSVQTLAVTIYSMTRMRISPKINALSTLLFTIVLVLLLINNIRERRQEKIKL